MSPFTKGVKGIVKYLQKKKFLQSNTIKTIRIKFLSLILLVAQEHVAFALGKRLKVSIF